MNIFLASENWLGEVEGMKDAQIFAIAENSLPEHREKVREVVDSWMSALDSKLSDAACSVKLSIGDYNEWVHAS